MKRTGESTIEITDDEMLQIYEFIHRSLCSTLDSSATSSKTSHR